MIEQLKVLLRQPGTVLFVGSGISRWSGLPSWEGLIAELSGYLRDRGISTTAIDNELERGDLLHAASYGFDELTPPQFAEFIRLACRQGLARPSQVHRLLASLGPNSFVTTNYDELLEFALRTWRPSESWRVVTNRNLAATAEIVHARAGSFVFKPHGDVHDPDSIILTREQYRKLLPQGEFAPALESLKTILISRPVVYLGFGLRDPDFLYVKDILRNIYGGRAPDHYAIVANPLPHEISHWRRHYGVHLMGYDAPHNEATGYDHSALEHLLRELGTDTESSVVDDTLGAAEHLLALARYGALVSRYPKKEPELRIRVNRQEQMTAQRQRMPDRLDYAFVDQFLRSLGGRAALVGLPGAGKSYALRRAVAELGGSLQTSCLETGTARHIVPIFADLKLYSGDLWKLVTDSLPAPLVLESLIEEHECRIYLDSLNEVAAEFIEAKVFSADLHGFLERVGDASVVIASRTSDGLEDLGLPFYALDEIEQETVKLKLTELGISAGRTVDDEILRLLQKPYYFQLVSSRLVDIPDGAHPRDLYTGLLRRLDSDFRTKFGFRLDITRSFQGIAYRSIEDGHETLGLSMVRRKLQASIDACAEARLSVGLDSGEVVDWLVGREFLIPYTGARISFVHQSVTEFLAATELAARFRADESLLRSRLIARRWDQALFLTLSLLEGDEAERFISIVLEADLSLAARGVRYVESGQEGLSTRVLEALLNRDIEASDPWEIGRVVGMLLPVEASHSELLRKLIRKGGAARHAAARALARALGYEAVDELLQLMFENRRDYNLCANAVGSALGSVLQQSDVSRIVALLDRIPLEERSDLEASAGGLTSGICRALSGHPLEVVQHEMLCPTSEADAAVRQHVFCEFLWKDHSVAGLRIAADLLGGGVRRAAVAINFIAVNESDLDWSCFNLSHVAVLAQMIEEGAERNWPVKVLRDICIAREDLCAQVCELAAAAKGIRKMALTFAAAGPMADDVFCIFELMVATGRPAFEGEPLHFLQEMNLDWNGREVLLQDVLRLRHTALARSVLERFYTDDQKLSSLDLGVAGPWIVWLEEEKDFFFRDRLTSFIMDSCAEDFRRSIVAEFNRCSNDRRAILAETLMRRMDGLTTDDLSAGAIGFLINDLYSRPVNRWEGHLLGMAATDDFVLDKLLPLRGTNNEVLSENLSILLRAAGRRHGKRYELIKIMGSVG